ncbi:hypothetical protein TUM4261_01670 [Shewanella sp. c952]|uniref:cysteine-rich CWC family protein n=1 Tax=Shewanella sp. c952 TaxID=2815913 RepID=UPI001BC1C111|nr:cysteine-rich CWC family protein [Shewanella sp. c952]GIU03633.1 hypothetical protein TUM4261_01670 [Shewanella sp. c952]
MTIDATSCPLCQSKNRCAVQQGESIEQCWCLSQQFPAKTVLDSEKLANSVLDAKSCLCQTCIKKLKQQEESQLYKRVD